MARSTRGGLGRGLNSLLGGGSDGSTATPRTAERERIVYDERENIPEEERITSPSTTGSFNSVSPNQNTRTPGSTGNINPVNSSNVRDSHTRETIELTDDIETTGRVTTRDVSRETSTPKETLSTILPTKKEEKEKINEVDIDAVSPNPDQPRTNFKKEELEELSRSIGKEGLIQPILVRSTGEGKYQIIAGERRWQASKLAGLKKVPIQIKEVDDDKALELALIENIQRSDLNPIEEAYGYKRLMERRKMTQADVAQAVSKGRSTIANALRLLELPEIAQQLLFEDKITAGHARAILSVPNKEGRESLTEKVIENKLNVRETESLARLMSNKPEKGSSTREPIPATYKSVAKALKDILKTSVKVKSSKGKNKIEIEFKDEKDLERIFEEMTAATID